MHQDPALTLLSMIAAHMWDRTPDKTRLRVVRDMQENARRKFEIVNERLRWSQARLFWQRYVVPGVLRSRLEVWKAYVCREDASMRARSIFVIAAGVLRFFSGNLG